MAVFMFVSKGCWNASTTINRAPKLFFRPDRIDGILVGVVLRILMQYATNIMSSCNNCCWSRFVHPITAEDGLWWHVCMNTVHFFHTLLYTLRVVAATDPLLITKASFKRESRR